ncbi:hypothetical protein [Hymenobacter volaticus]|uniref:Uncharacterized protein n=1 Tax=Hymenobacter volaticus TaxID=2932254 RepID=A0ABY4GFG6_9BACT|nr:hypothetical protein [Hymenobacter volaticus]UOQ69545.1 hypothetical protein MUN86_28305 [Hymenobacter volaticus]
MGPAYNSTTLRRSSCLPPHCSRPAPTDEELVLACVILFVGQLDLTAWLTQVAACEPERELTLLLGALARGELHESSWSGLIPRLLGSDRAQRKLRTRLASQPWPLNLLLSLLGKYMARPTA